MWLFQLIGPQKKLGSATSSHKTRRMDHTTNLDSFVKPVDNPADSVHPSLLSDTQFKDLHLDERLLQTIAKLGWRSPSLIQSAAIPLVLQGKDILAKWVSFIVINDMMLMFYFYRARTGSGKTAAYSLPAIQMLLNLKAKTGPKVRPSSHTT